MATTGGRPSTRAKSTTPSGDFAPKPSVACARNSNRPPGAALEGIVKAKVCETPLVKLVTNGMAPSPTTMILVTATSSAALTCNVKGCPFVKGPVAGDKRVKLTVGGWLLWTVRTNWAKGPSLPKRSVAMARKVVLPLAGKVALIPNGTVD